MIWPGNSVATHSREIGVEGGEGGEDGKAIHIGRVLLLGVK